MLMSWTRSLPALLAAALLCLSVPTPSLREARADDSPEGISLKFDLARTHAAYAWGYRMDEARQDLYWLDAGLDVGGWLSLDTDMDLLGDRGRYVEVSRSGSVSLHQTISDEGLLDVALGYGQTIFRNPIAGSTRGFRGAERLRAASVKLKLLDVFRLNVTRSLEDGDAGGTHSELGLHLSTTVELPLVGPSAVGCYLGTNYNHHFFRRNSGISFNEALFVLSIPLAGHRGEENGRGRGVVLLTPYVGYQDGQDKEFPDAWKTGLMLSFRF